jgi:hypothetical protein
MLENSWDANDVYTVLEAPHQHNFGLDITVLRMDANLQIVIGYKEDGSVFFGCPQIGDIQGFKKGRAKLDVMQSIDLKERGTVEPALALSFLVNSDEELRAISTIFSGLYDLNRNAQGSEKATLAAQGFEDYFADLPKIGLTSEIETGLFGELSIIAASKNKDALVKGWHSSPDATYDFSFDGNRLEVKTSTRPTRLVWLRSSQSLRSVDANLTYLSVFAPIDEGGMTIDELAGNIRTSLSMTLKSIFDEKLSYYEIATSSHRFDYLTAVNSFRFILSSDIPVPSADDPRILDLRWKCNFESLSNTGDPDTWL